MDYTIDWGQNSKNLVILDADGKRIPWKGDFFSWIRTLKAGDSVLIESTFEPYHHQTKIDIIDYCEENGIRLRVINPRETANQRKTNGTAKKSKDNPLNEVDAKILHDFKATNKHFSEAKRPKAKPLTWKDEVNIWRRSQWKTCQHLFAHLPKKVQAEHKNALTNTGKYSDGFVLPVLSVALHVKKDGLTRDDFDKEVGYYGNGYPSYFRSTFYRRVMTLVKRELGTKSLKGINLKRDHAEMHKRLMKDVRKACRWIFQNTRVGTINPV